MPAPVRDDAVPSRLGPILAVAGMVIGVLAMIIALLDLARSFGDAAWDGFVGFCGFASCWWCMRRWFEQNNGKDPGTDASA